MKMALEGIRVIDVSEAGLAPVCCRVLADMGAEVIKIERTEGGDQTRGIIKRHSSSIGRRCSCYSSAVVHNRLPIASETSPE